jgi:hypothetical protein
MASRLLLAAAALLAAPLVAAAPGQAAAAVPGPAAAAPAQAAAAPPDVYGFAYVDTVALGGPFVPDPTRQWVSSGGVVTVTSPAVGAYTVLFPGIAVAGGTAHVTAVTRAGEWCQVWQYGPSGGSERVDVRCFRPGGAPATSRFLVMFSNGAGLASPGQYASVRVNPAGAVMNSENTSGAPNSVVGGGGTYTVTLPNVGLGANPSGGLQVTAAGTVPARCNVAGWSTGAAAQTVGVRCFNPGGAPAPSGFTLSYQFKRSIVSSVTPPGRFGYVFDTVGAIPPAAQYNSSGGPITLTTLGTGIRQVTFAGIGAQPDTAQITAFSGVANYCTTALPPATSGGSVTLQYVVCYNNAGTYTTTRSLVSYTSRF